MNRPFVATVAAPAPHESGSGWRSMDSAPRDRMVLLLIKESGGMTAHVGYREGSTWHVRPPYSGEQIQVRPRAWAAIPRTAA
jgi:hypothetical protein